VPVAAGSHSGAIDKIVVDLKVEWWDPVAIATVSELRAVARGLVLLTLRL